MKDTNKKDLQEASAMSNNTHLPVLDIQIYYSDPSIFAEKLRSACHKVGFFLLRHDLPPSLAERQIDEARKFFRQPLDNKMQVSYENSPAFRGYMKWGVENTGGKTDLREQIEFGTEYSRPESTAALTRDGPIYERLKGTNQWPDSFQPTLRENTTEYVERICRIAGCLQRCMCLALELDENVLAPIFDEPHWFLKLISYPPFPRKNDSFGVGAHTDTNFLTLVLQDQVGGLQVFSHGEWIDVPTNVDNVLVCNLGEQAEIFSRGYFLATPHRVLANTGSKQERISVAFFYNPSLSSKIAAPNKDYSSLPWERPGGYEKEQHWRMEGNILIDSVGDNTFKSLARSHEKVFHKHHKDLIRLGDGRIVYKGKDKEQSGTER